MWPIPQKTADLVAFTEKIVSGNFIFLCSVIHCNVITLLNKFEHSYLVNDESHQFKKFQYICD